jgi:hypothetical protein
MIFLDYYVYKNIFLRNLGKIIYEMATLRIYDNDSLFILITKENLFSYQNAKLNSKKYPRLPEIPYNYSLKINSIYER